MLKECTLAAGGVRGTTRESPLGNSTYLHMLDIKCRRMRTKTHTSNMRATSGAPRTRHRGKSAPA